MSFSTPETEPPWLPAKFWAAAEELVATSEIVIDRPKGRHYRFLGTPTIDSASIAQLVPLERGLGVNDAAGWKDVEMPADTTPSVPL